MCLSRLLAKPMGFKLPWRLLIPPGSVDTVIGTDSGLELARKTGATVQLVLFSEVFDVDGQRAVSRHGKWQKFHFDWIFVSKMFLQNANEPAGQRCSTNAPMKSKDCIDCGRSASDTKPRCFQS